MRNYSAMLLALISLLFNVLFCGENYYSTFAQRPAAALIRQALKNRGQKSTLNYKDAKVDLTWIKGNVRGRTFGPGDYAREIVSGRQNRYYEIHVPPGYTNDRATPVVLMFHGGGGNPNQQRHDSCMDAVADKHNFIVVYPAGTGFFKDKLLTFNCKICCGWAKNHGVDDVAYTRDLLDDLASLFSVDTNRVYSSGLSNGALMSYRLASQLSDRIAAIGPVACHLPVDYFGAPPPRPVSIIDFHGIHDNHAAYYGGIGENSYARLLLQPLPETIQTWIRHDGCSPKPVNFTRVGNAVCADYGIGRDGSQVILWTLEDGGHTWPGGKMTLGEEKLKLGKINTDISASELMWQFFEKHPMNQH